MQTLIRVGCFAHECAVGCHAAPFVAGMRPGALRQLGSARSSFKRTVGVQPETMQIVCDFSAADDFCRDAHIDIRRESQRQTRPRRRSKLHVAAQTRTDACRQVVAWTAVLGLPAVAAREPEDIAAIGP